MKSTRKLIPALAMLLLSAIMVSTASFAWFSMNTTVTANGMQIQAKSDQTFLLISATKSTASEIQAEFASNATFARDAVLPSNITVYPAAVKGTPTKDSDLKFQYAVGTSYDNGAAKDGVYTEVSSLENYVVKYTFYLTVAAGAVPASDIVVKSITFTGDAAVNAVVTTDSAAVIFAGSSATESQTVLSGGLNAGDTTNAGKLTDTSVLPVHVYVYFNGDDARVTTANSTNLANTTVTVTFGVKGAGAN